MPAGGEAVAAWLDAHGIDQEHKPDWGSYDLEDEVRVGADGKAQILVQGTWRPLTP